MKNRFLKFVCIDDWNRPIFEVIESKGTFISDLNNLFSQGTTIKEIKEFYKKIDKPLNEILTYHGTRIYCEPYGFELTKKFNYVIK